MNEVDGRDGQDAGRRQKRKGGDEAGEVGQRAELFGELVAPVERVGARFVPNPAAAALEAQVYPSPARVVAAAQRTLAKAGARG